MLRLCAPSAILPFVGSEKEELALRKRVGLIVEAIDEKVFSVAGIMLFNRMRLRLLGT